MVASFYANRRSLGGIHDVLLDPSPLIGYRFLQLSDLAGLLTFDPCVRRIVLSQL
jgi:hypothetical protein